MKKGFLGIAVIVGLILAGFGAWFFRNPPPADGGSPEAVSIGKMPIEAHTLIYIAEEQGFFARNGLDVTIRNYSTGPAAVNGLIEGEVDIAGASEFVVVGHALRKERIGIIASIDKYQIFYMVGRKDSGIARILDLKGKRIGVGMGSAAEFFLGRFLNLHGISLRDVTLIDTLPSQYVNSVLNGSVDAVVFNRPYQEVMSRRLGDNGVFWPVQSCQQLYSVMVCRNDWIARHPATIDKFLRSLAQAEAYLGNYPGNARALIQKKLQYSDKYLAAIWPEHQFSLTLAQSLVTTMEDEGRWMMANRLTAEKELPDYQHSIYATGLERIKPESVNIIKPDGQANIR